MAAKGTVAGGVSTVEAAVSRAVALLVEARQGPRAVRASSASWWSRRVCSSRGDGAVFLLEPVVDDWATPCNYKECVSARFLLARDSVIEGKKGDEPCRRRSRSSHSRTSCRGSSGRL